MKLPLDGPPVFFSTFMYSAIKVEGGTSEELLAREMRDGVESLDRSVWPGFRTMGQAARTFDPLRVFVDGSTYITRARCVCAGHFLRKAGSDCDVWLTCDDDIFADAEVCARLVSACRVTEGLVALPYMNRNGETMTFRKVRAPTLTLGPDLLVRSVDRVGMGLCAMHRRFIQELDDDAEHFEDQYPGIFLEGVQQGSWVGEDYWLCTLAEARNLPMHVLLEAPGEHDGLRAMLDREGRILVQGQGAATKLQAGLDRAACMNPQSQGE